MYKNDDPRIGDIGSVWEEEELIMTLNMPIYEILDQYDIYELPLEECIRLERKTK